MGAFFYDRRNRSATASDDSVPTPVDTISALLRSSGIDAPTAQLVAGLYSRALAAIPVDFSADASGHVRSYALFGDVQFRLTERLMFTVGFRYDHETNSLGIDQTARSEEHTSELQSLMRISYAVFCLKKKKNTH